MARRRRNRVRGIVEPKSDAAREAVRLEIERRAAASRLALNPRDVWATIPMPYESDSFLVTDELAEYVMTGHRQFRPEIVHRTLSDAGGTLNPALTLFYGSVLRPDQIETMKADMAAYIADVDEDVFGLDSNRELNLGPNQIMKCAVEGWNEMFIFPNFVDDINTPAATLCVYVDSSGDQCSIRFFMDDAAREIWGYTHEEFTRLQEEDYQCHVEADQLPSCLKRFSFAFSLFTPRSAKTMIMLNLLANFLKASQFCFDFEILRRDGRIVPVNTIYTAVVDQRFALIGILSFRPTRLQAITDAIATLDIQTVI